jgi:hypothetical protein
MSALRYAVLDANGVKLNGIMVDDPYPQAYWPGYGRYITCEFGEPDPTPPADLNIREGFSYLLVRPLARFSIGDTMNIETGEITYAPPPEPEPEPVE